MFQWLVVARGEPHTIPPDRVEQALDLFGRDVEAYVSHDATGRVTCRWAAAPLRLWGRVRAFALFLAEREGAVVLDERMEPVGARSPAGPRKRA